MTPKIKNIIEAIKGFPPEDKPSCANVRGMLTTLEKELKCLDSLISNFTNDDDPNYAATVFLLDLDRLEVEEALELAEKKLG